MEITLGFDLVFEVGRCMIILFEAHMLYILLSKQPIGGHMTESCHLILASIIVLCYQNVL